MEDQINSISENNENHELHSWSEQLQITVDQLEEAIQAVGLNVDRVETYLDRNY